MTFLPTLPYPPLLISEQKPWLFFEKPHGMHTVPAGKKQNSKNEKNFSLEEMLPHILPAETKGQAVFLCNRLDAATSGIVVGAGDEKAVATWRRMEQQQLCRKLYVALVTGHRQKNISQQWIVKRSLNTHKRKISQILSAEAEKTRHTSFVHLKMLTHEERCALTEYARTFTYLQDEDTQKDTVIHLVGCTIYQGARHQIRAHAAHSQYPLWNDTRYAHRQIPQKKEFFFLHHGALFIPSCHIVCLPHWLQCLMPETQKKILQFYENADELFFSWGDRPF